METSKAKRYVVGDFIDRMSNQIETIEIVRRMVDTRNAMAVMGNRELNTIAWYLPVPYNLGEYLRTHHYLKYSNKNYRQNKAFLNEVSNQIPTEFANPCMENNGAIS